MGGFEPYHLVITMPPDRLHIWRTVVFRSGFESLLVSERLLPH